MKQYLNSKRKEAAALAKIFDAPGLNEEEKIEYITGSLVVGNLIENEYIFSEEVMGKERTRAVEESKKSGFYKLLDILKFVVLFAAGGLSAYLGYNAFAMYRAGVALEREANNFALAIGVVLAVSILLVVVLTGLQIFILYQRAGAWERENSITFVTDDGRQGVFIDKDLEAVLDSMRALSSQEIITSNIERLNGQEVKLKGRIRELSLGSVSFQKGSSADKQIFDVLSFVIGDSDE